MERAEEAADAAGMLAMDAEEKARSTAEAAITAAVAAAIAARQAERVGTPAAEMAKTATLEERHRQATEEAAQARRNWWAAKEAAKDAEAAAEAARVDWRRARLASTN